jgi:hypothetical protein
VSDYPQIYSGALGRNLTEEEIKALDTHASAPEMIHLPEDAVVVDQADGASDSSVVVVEEPPAESKEPETQPSAPLYPPPPKALIQAVVYQFEQMRGTMKAPQFVSNAAEAFVSALVEWSNGRQA